MEGLLFVASELGAAVPASSFPAFDSSPAGQQWWKELQFVGKTELQV